MKIDRRITNGLAWAGVFIVVGVPAADLLSAQFLGDPAKAPPQVAVVAPVAPMPAPLSQRPEAPETEVAEVEDVAPVPAAPPAKPAATKTADAVDTYLQSGRSLPSYVTGGSDDAVAPAQVAVTPPAAKPNPVEPAATDQAAAPPVRPVIETDPMQVAAIPAKVAPVPMPLSMRPAPVPAMTAAVPPAGETIVLPPSVNAPAPPVSVTSADLADWETGPLSEFLAKRQQGNANAYSGDGFFLDEAPGKRRPQPDRFIGPVDDGFWFAD